MPGVNGIAVGYPAFVHHRQQLDGQLNAAQTLLNAVMVVGVVVAVLTFLLGTVYTVVYLDLIPQMR